MFHIFKGFVTSEAFSCFYKEYLRKQVCQQEKGKKKRSMWSGPNIFLSNQYISANSKINRFVFYAVHKFSCQVFIVQKSSQNAVILKLTFIGLVYSPFVFTIHYFYN